MSGVIRSFSNKSRIVWNSMNYLRESVTQKIPKYIVRLQRRQQRQHTIFMLSACGYGFLTARSQYIYTFCNATMVVGIRVAFNEGDSCPGEANFMAVLRRGAASMNVILNCNFLKSGII